MVLNTQPAEPEAAGLHAIEALVSRYPGIDRAVAVIRDGGTGDDQIAVYATVSSDDAVPAVDAVRQWLAGQLPGYAVPDAVVLLDTLPLTPDGAVEQALLPEPGPSAFDPTSSTRSELVFELIGSVFGLPTVDPACTFAEIGADSLQIGRLVTTIRSVLDVEVRVRDVMEADTIGSFIELLDQRDAPHPSTEGAARAVEDDGPNDFLSPLGSAYRLTGPLDHTALGQAMSDVRDRHEALWAPRRFPADGAPGDTVVADSDLSTIAVVESELTGRLDAEVARPVDRHAQLPWRATLFELGAADHVVLLVADPARCDERSMRVVWQDLGQAYSARVAGCAPAWEKLPRRPAEVQPGPVRLAAADGARSVVDARHLTYWREVLRDLPTELALPFDRPRPAQPTRRSGSVELAVHEDLHAGLRSVARAHQATLRMVLYAGVGALLTRLGSGCDLPLGGRTDGRRGSGLSSVVGALRNDVVLRVDTSGEPRFSDLIARVRATALAADAHRDVPFARLVAEVRPDRRGAAHPLFQVAVDVETAAPTRLRFQGLSAAVLPVDTGFGLDLAITFHRIAGPRVSAGALTGVLRYATDVFRHDTAVRIANGLVQLLEAVVKSPDLPIGELPLPDAAPIGRGGR